uniref:uncharacterized protein LOC117607320 n=1 Tax=Osmia lignaria TaxID=473952 RepID=UPI0014795B9E|nr:uncharacterized protein LOC117607320 [Osmia lignaria]
MFEISTFNVDKLIHTFIQNFGLKIKSSAYNNSNKVAFVSYVDRTCKIKQQLSCSTAKINEINMQQQWDFTNEKDIQRFIEKHTNFFDKMIFLKNTGILTSPLKNINTKILQKVRKKKKDHENTKKTETKIKKKRSLLSPLLHKDKCPNLFKYKRNKYKKTTVCANSNILSNDIITHSDHKDINIFKTNNDNQKDFLNHNLSDSMMNITKRKIETAKKLLWLHTKDKKYIKRNIEIILHISKKSNYCSMQNQMKYSQVLCHHAILCLIEPSKRAVVLFEDDLSTVIEKYLLHGYKYNFESQRYFN